MEASHDKSFEERQVLAFEKLPLGVEVNEAFKNKRCLSPEYSGRVRLFHRMNDLSGNFSAALIFSLQLSLVSRQKKVDKIQLCWRLQGPPACPETSGA